MTPTLRHNTHHSVETSVARGNTGFHRGGRMAWFVCLGALVALLVACSPTHNWRLVRPAGASVAALMPCKPDSAQRTVSLAGHPAELAMLSCDVGEQTFAMGVLPLPQGLSPAEAAMAWQRASVASLQAPADSAQPWAAKVARLPAGSEVRGWQVQGQRHDSRPVRAQALQVLRPTEVVQLVVYGAAPAEVLQTLWDGVQPDAAP